MNPENLKHLLFEIWMMVLKISDEVLKSFEIRIRFRSYFSSHEYRSPIRFSGNDKTLIVSWVNTNLFDLKNMVAGSLIFATIMILVTSTIRDKAVRELYIETNLYSTCFRDISIRLLQLLCLQIKIHFSLDPQTRKSCFMIFELPLLKLLFYLILI